MCIERILSKGLTWYCYKCYYDRLRSTNPNQLDHDFNSALEVTAGSISGSRSSTSRPKKVKHFNDKLELNDITSLGSSGAQEHKAIWTLEQPVSVTKAASAWTIGAVVAGLGHQLSAAESQWAGDLVTMVGQGCRSRTMHGTGQGGHHWQQTPPQDLPTTYSIGQVITFIISYQNTFYDLLSGQRYELTCEATVGGGREENFNNSFYFFIRTVMFFVKYVFFSWIKSSSP